MREHTAGFGQRSDNVRAGQLRQVLQYLRVHVLHHRNLPSARQRGCQPLHTAITHSSAKKPQIHFTIFPPTHTHTNAWSNEGYLSASQQAAGQAGDRLAADHHVAAAGNDSFGHAPLLLLLCFVEPGFLLRDNKPFPIHIRVKLALSQRELAAAAGHDKQWAT